MVWLANPERYGQMQYRYCGKSGLRLPALSLGLWHNFGHVNALESQRAILRKAFDLGITHFDLAGNDSNLLIVFYVQIMPDDFVMQLHR
ncbi:hypothetical protein OFB78_27605, partial [Escherichia coli]|nr:hypothetical protein [Escherichia coli]MCV5111064.1 hypothetical protein [Escherichia coli]